MTPKNRNIGKPRAVALFIAILAGLTIGSRERLLALYKIQSGGSWTYMQAENAIDSSDLVHESDYSATASRSSGPRNADIDDERQTNTSDRSALRESEIIRAHSGLSLIPVRDGDNFIGFKVLQNGTDSRFSVGDIIAAVNGKPVEDSAAGGELLVIALMDQKSIFQFANR
jgi:hypothetical protein